MTTAALRFSSLFATALLLACSSNVASSPDEDTHAEPDASRDEVQPSEPSEPDAAQPDAAVPAAPDSDPERAVETFEAGAGDATVVFEAGFGDDWTPWEQVAREVAKTARVFAYSRPGYGHSDPATDPRDASHIVEDLRALLAAHGYAPPYVLVGHSFGGAYMELFAKAHPREVAGLVLVDPRHPDFSAACAQAGLDGCDIPDDLVATLPPVQIAEYEAFARTAEEMRTAGAFGSYPVRVLTATSHGFTPEVEALWVSLLGSLADEAEHGEQVLFEGAGHYLQLERPADVTAAITSLTAAATAAP